MNKVVSARFGIRYDEGGCQDVLVDNPAKLMAINRTEDDYAGNGNAIHC